MGATRLPTTSTRTGLTARFRGASSTSVQAGSGPFGVRGRGQVIPWRRPPGASTSGGTRASSVGEGTSQNASSAPSTCSTPPSASPSPSTANESESGASSGRDDPRPVRVGVELQVALVASIYLLVEVMPGDDAEGRARQRALVTPAKAEADLVLTIRDGRIAAVQDRVARAAAGPAPAEISPVLERVTMPGGTR